MPRLSITTALALVMLLLLTAAAQAARPLLSAQPKRVNLGEVTLGNGSPAEPVFYTNRGSNSLVLTLPAFNDATWFGSGLLAEQPGLAGCGTGVQLLPDQTCTVGYVFNPQTTGRQSTKLTVTYQELGTGATGGATVTLVGTAVAP